MRKIFLPATFIFLYLFLASEVLSSEAPKVLISAPSRSLTWFPAHLAKEKGFYREEGLDVDFVIMKPQVALQALVSGDVLYTTAIGSTMRAAFRGLPVRVVMTICEKPHFVLVARPGIQSVEGLRGKILGVSSLGASTDTMARALLAKSRLIPGQDVKILAVGGGTNRLAALQSRAIDATLLEAPYNLMAEREGFARILFVGDLIPSPIAGFGTTLEHMRRDSDAIRRLIKATLRGIRYAKSHKQESVQSITKWTEMDAALAEGAYEMAVGTWSNSGVPNSEALKAALEEAKRELKVDAPLDPARAFDWSFVPK